MDTYLHGADYIYTPPTTHNVIFTLYALRPSVWVGVAGAEVCYHMERMLWVDPEV